MISGYVVKTVSSFSLASSCFSISENCSTKSLSLSFRKITYQSIITFHKVLELTFLSFSTKNDLQIKQLCIF